MQVITEDQSHNTLSPTRASFQGPPRRISGDLPSAFKGQPLRQQVELVHKARKLSATIDASTTLVSEEEDQTREVNNECLSNSHNESSANQGSAIIGNFSQLVLTINRIGVVH